MKYGNILEIMENHNRNDCKFVLFPNVLNKTVNRILYYPDEDGNIASKPVHHSSFGFLLRYNIIERDKNSNDICYRLDQSYIDSLKYR